MWFVVPMSALLLVLLSAQELRTRNRRGVGITQERASRSASSRRREWTVEVGTLGLHQSRRSASSDSPTDEVPHLYEPEELHSAEPHDGRSNGKTDRAYPSADTGR